MNRSCLRPPASSRSRWAPGVGAESAPEGSLSCVRGPLSRSGLVLVLVLVLELLAAVDGSGVASADGAGSSVTVTRSGWAKQPRVPGARMRRAQGSWGRGTCSAPRRCRSGKHPAFQPSPEHPPRWPGWQVHRVARPWVLSPWGRCRVAPSHRPRLRRREPPWGWPSPPPCTPAGHSFSSSSSSKPQRRR